MDMHTLRNAIACDLNDIQRIAETIPGGGGKAITILNRVNSIRAILNNNKVV